MEAGSRLLLARAGHGSDGRVPAPMLNRQGRFVVWITSPRVFVMDEYLSVEVAVPDMPPGGTKVRLLSVANGITRRAYPR